MNIGSPIPIITNHDNEPVTLIAVPLQLFQQATQQQSFIVEQNVLFNTLPDGTIVIDTNQLLNNDNNCDITTTTDVNSNNENSDFILTVQQKDDNLITNESNISNTNNATKKEEKNTSKIRYLNNKTLDIRKVGRPKKDISKLNNSDPENKGPFICKYCKKEFDKWLIFKRHEKSHMNEKKYKCSLCPSSFNILINHVLHIATHNTDDPKCPECGKKFQRIASLKAHIMYHEKEETFYCEDCDILFDNDVEMNEHIKTHGQEKEKKERIDNLKCKYCQLTFTEQSSFKKHMMEHNKMRHILQSPIRKKPKRSGTIERKHQCNSCSKAFQKRSQIERHMRVHTGEKPFVCKICNKGFSQKGSLQIHMSRHTGNKPHKCTLCQAKFTQKGNLRAHILKTHSVPHEGENVYCCTECSCVFKRLGSLNGHITRNHPKDKNNDLKYVLSQLSAIQSSMSNIDNDILQQAINKSDIPGQNIEEPPDSPSAIYVTLAGSGLDGNMRRYVIKQRKVGDIRWHLCSLCPKEFKKPSDLVRHIRVHTREKPFMCKYCGRSFAIKSTLTTHMKTHMKLTKVECKYCHKFFSSWNSLNAHMLKHTAPKQKCQVCNKSYRSKSQLNQHCKNHSAESSAYYKEPNSNTIMLQPIQITSRGLEPVSSLRKRPILEAGCKSRPHTCKVCSGAFRKLSHLKQHYLLKHTEERPYTCYHCFRNFGSSSNLYTHIATHTGMRPYSCSVCKKDFTTNGSLKRHMVTHNLDKPFICPICFLDFKTLPQCKKHIETHAPSDINIHMETDDNVDTNELVDTETNLTYNSNIDNNLVNSYTVVQPLNNTNLEEIPKNVTDKIENSTSLLSSSVKENNSVILSVKQQNLPQGNINEIEDTLNSQMLNIIGSENFVDSSTYVNKLDVSQPIATTDELVNTLTGSAEPQKNIVDNSYLYQQVIVNLNPDPEQIPIFDNNGLDNIVTQLRLQNESLFLTDLNSLNMNETNNVLLPFQIAQQPEIQQNQLIMLPTEFEQEIHTTPIQNTVNLETIDTSLQLKLNNMNRILNSVPNITDPNIVINTTPIQTENEFLNVQNIEENIITTPITQISSLSGKNIENNVLTEVLCNQKQNSLLINNEKTSETVDIVCNMCKQNFKTKNELKCHQCINYINIEIANSNINNKNKTKPINSQNNEEGVVNLNIQLENSNRTEVVDNGEMDILNVKDKNITPKEFQEFVARKTKIDSQKTNESVDPKVKHRNQCPYCPKSFRKPSDLQRHIRTHTGERPFKCTECDKKFSLKSTLDSHNKIHQGKKEYVCMVCNCFFATNGSLTVHMRLHTGVKPFKCPLCSLKFRTSGHRKAHLTVHYKEVLKTGKISSDGVARKTKMSELMKKVENMINSNINEEQNNKDDNEIEFNLQNIPLGQELPLESFVETSLELQADDKQSNMHYEIETNTEGQITNIKPTASNILFIDETSKKEVVSTQVDFDDKTKLQIENFLRDKKDKISESKNKIKKVCNICHKEFSSKYLLDRHSKIHTGERIFSCDYCSKSFNQKNTLQIHKRTHSGTRPYSCPHCANTFSQIGNLKTHIKRIHSHIEQSQQNTDTLCSGFIINDITENLPT